MHVVIGLGKTGLSILRFLAAKNIPATIIDNRLEPPALKQCQQDFPKVKIICGAYPEELLLKATAIILSPGVDPRESSIMKARNNNVPILGDVELFARELTAPVIAITGSNGKTTLTTLMGEVLTQAGFKVCVCGNIGTPVLDVLQQSVPDYYVLELSSFQLETLQSLQPLAAVVLNVSPDHMDRYASSAEYLQAKQAVYQNCQHAIVNA
ncbi:MAG: UDP-N-acetylmuramoyl-L-alanine--D-glutamate ligase, partial [Gammaproteobacteria bacterium]|nr:UDP-N-acetylmuramoyl-L-alanine--D-glutamate ligase [Gammaproteobacteria bacterium]